jgi:hypothetical protein
MMTMTTFPSTARIYSGEALASEAAEAYVLTRPKSHPTSAPSTRPSSGAKGTSVVTLTRIPSASPITAPTTRKNHVPLASFPAFIAPRP